jgi:hypothetical protein
MLTDKDDDLGIVLKDLLGSMDRKAVSTYHAHHQLPAVIKAASWAREGNHRLFYFGMIHPLNTFVDGLLKEAVPDCPDGRFILKHSNYIANHFNELVIRFDGPACSADKSNMIMRALLAYYLHDTPIEFDYLQKVTYHLPHNVLTTQSEIVVFYKAIHSLYFGQADAYLALMGKFMARSAGVPPPGPIA